MCDTVVALGNSTRSGAVLFGKNSDREPNEAHELVHIPAGDHQPGEVVKCTYVEVPQVPHTHAIFLAKPFWIWGAEMGANEHGVVIGNEAVFTKVPYEKGPGLIGMDFLRLALERSDNAEKAMYVIIHLLETYGQGGNCGFAHPFYYHNSFLIADTQQAWVLETAGRQWAAEKVKDIRSISNSITIETEWDLASDDLIRFAMDSGWCSDKGHFNFARCYSDFLYTRFSDAHRRQRCTINALYTQKGTITLHTIMQALRQHTSPETNGWTPDQAIFGSDVCMHAGFGPMRGSQSVGSMVSSLGQDGCEHWVTGTAAPCTGIFKPVWIDAGLPDLGPAPSGRYDPETLFWKHERLHRQVLFDYPARMALYAGDRDELETQFLAGAEPVRKGSPAERLAYSQECFDQALARTDQWIQMIEQSAVNKKTVFYYQRAWNSFNQQAQLLGSDVRLP
ncbi:MAG: C69 family dipeptidase [Anaerolineaceae bacterium]|nr:C69 family dipeptidase [Anaerolineaceae bacterium]